MASCSKFNLDTIKEQIVRLDLQVKTEFYWDGLQVIDRVNTVINQPSKLKILRPICALLIDYKMPIKNGLQVFQKIQMLYKTYNRQTETLRTRRPLLIEPCYILMTENALNIQLQAHCKEIGINLQYIKPIKEENIKEIFL